MKYLHNKKITKINYMNKKKYRLKYLKRESIQSTCESDKKMKEKFMREKE